MDKFITIKADFNVYVEHKSSRKNAKDLSDDEVIGLFLEHLLKEVNELDTSDFKIKSNKARTSFRIDRISELE